MSKLSKRAILTFIVIATLLTVMIPFMPASAAVLGNVILETKGSGTATWTKAYAHSGDYSVKLTAPVGSTPDGPHSGKIILPLEMAFNELEDFSVYVYMLGTRFAMRN